MKIGDLVRFNHEHEGEPAHRVVSVMRDGMVELNDMGGYFAPYLFVVANEIGDIPQHDRPKDKTQGFAVCADHRKEIMRLMREDFDPTPPNWEGRDWDDNADNVADKIIALFGSESPTQTSDEPCSVCGGSGNIFSQKFDRDGNERMLWCPCKESLLPREPGTCKCGAAPINKDGVCATCADEQINSNALWRAFHAGAWPRLWGIETTDPSAAEAGLEVVIAPCMPEHAAKTLSDAYNLAIRMQEDKQPPQIVIDAYLGISVLRAMCKKARLTGGQEASDQLIGRMEEEYPALPALSALRHHP